ncbi:hypothetical protein [Marinobacter sp. JSM 1782161]|uniref:hypothetical protein n=1 Tax=Marinobacter sp. JSM 1782161 TaxID=2685906 RepID=UPI0014035C5A|nr:hypothetical protein [Marinobacter sp. JSM 1782161]
MKSGADGIGFGGEHLTQETVPSVATTGASELLLFEMVQAVQFFTVPFVWLD